MCHGYADIPPIPIRIWLRLRPGLRNSTPLGRRVVANKFHTYLHTHTACVCVVFNNFFIYFFPLQGRLIVLETRENKKRWEHGGYRGVTLAQ